MAYKVSGTESIKDDQTVLFNNITATQRATVFNGIGASASNGYVAGGNYPYGFYRDIIDKFPFSSDANATDVGDLSQTRTHTAGQSSSSHGYISGGQPNYNTIDKFPFSSDDNASDVGDLTAARNAGSGQQG